MKCMPITLSGRLVTLASLVMEMEEVLLAMMASGLRILSRAVRTDCLTLIFSTMAYVDGMVLLQQSRLLCGGNC